MKIVEVYRVSYIDGRHSGYYGKYYTTFLTLKEAEDYKKVVESNFGVRLENYDNQRPYRVKVKKYNALDLEDSDHPGRYHILSKRSLNEVGKKYKLNSDGKRRDWGEREEPRKSISYFF